MPLPSQKDIIRAIKLPSNITLPQLEGYKPKESRLGGLWKDSGSFGVVFQMQKMSSKVAFRVWYTEIENIKGRMNELSNFQKHHSLPFIVNFSFHEGGLRVPGENGVQFLDTMTMDWVEGLNLKAYLQSIIVSSIGLADKKRRLKELANLLLIIFRRMHHLKISHGDLQHGNIIIDNHGRIKLIDYDSFYIPNSQYKKRITKGIPGYQHPNRGYALYNNERTDYFSELIIYLSIIGLSEDITLWNRYCIEQDEYSLIFKASDYTHISQSKLYQELYRKTPQLKRLCTILVVYLQTRDINSLQPFDTLLDENIRLQKASFGRYCIMCGKVFTSSNDHYCIYCGSNRV